MQKWTLCMLMIVGAGLFGCASTEENPDIYMVRHVNKKPVRHDSPAIVNTTIIATIIGRPKKPLITLWLSRPTETIIGINSIKVLEPGFVSTPVISPSGTDATFQTLKEGLVTIVFYTERGRLTRKLKIEASGVQKPKEAPKTNQ